MTRLILDEQGIHIVGIFKASAKWEELTEIPLIEGLRVWGIYYDSKSKRLLLPLGHIVARPARKKLIVKTVIDWKKFKATEFGQILYKHAPQLFPETER